MCDLTNPVFRSEAKARRFLEKQRWPDGPVCPWRDLEDGKLHLVSESPMKNKTGQPVKGYYHCRSCRKRFTVRTGTLYERSHIPLHKWLLATHLLVSSKKGISAHQLHRSLKITYKSAWFMAHRIREGMKETNPTPLGGGGKVVEADETYIGNKKRSKRTDVLVPGKGWVKRGGGTGTNYKVISLVERGGPARSVHVPAITANSARDVLLRNIERKTTKLVTDESRIYKTVGKQFESHQSVNHSAYEWGRGYVHTNTIEGFFSIFKRGMRGIYQHCSEAHLHRYLAEFDFRYSHRHMTDSERAAHAVKGIEGKRLTYRGTNSTHYH